ncbi:MAG: hypothetical protein F2793_10415, partial [Actinobacteria bacterium]|nr:hypothetical protein [Actinomycetota bacterium]
MTDETRYLATEPSGLGRYSSLEDLRGQLADGGFRTLTAYEGSTPLASAIPHDAPIADPGPGADPDVPVRLSRFAYLRRDGNSIRVETPLTAAYVEVLDPRVGALVAALAFE